MRARRSPRRWRATRLGCSSGASTSASGWRGAHRWRWPTARRCCRCSQTCCRTPNGTAATAGASRSLRSPKSGCFASRCRTTAAASPRSTRRASSSGSTRWATPPTHARAKAWVWGCTSSRASSCSTAGTCRSRVRWARARPSPSRCRSRPGLCQRTENRPNSGMPFQLTCLVTTYRAPRWLRLCLHALAADAARLPDPGTIELLVGDDGDEEHQSRPVVEEIARKGVFGAVRRFWQRRAGFGKCRLGNRGAAASRAPLVYFLDGDCLVAPGTLAAHLRLFRPRRYVAGSPVRLRERASAALSVADVERGRHAGAAFLLSRALAGGVESKAHYPLLRSGMLAPLFRRTGSGGLHGGGAAGCGG